jgi:hypothetical protein
MFKPKPKPTYTSGRSVVWAAWANPNNRINPKAIQSCMISLKGRFPHTAILLFSSFDPPSDYLHVSSLQLFDRNLLVISPFLFVDFLFFCSSLLLPN